jgi:hypothetical protein
VRVHQQLREALNTVETRWGMILLAVYLILVGLSVVGVIIPLRLTGIVALVAGILLLIPVVRR